MSTRNGQRSEQSASLNNTRRTQGRTSRDKGGATVISTGISFVAGSNIVDSNDGFGALSVGDRIEGRGSPRNSREFRVHTAAAGTIAVRPQLVTSEDAGATITITRKD